MRTTGRFLWLWVLLTILGTAILGVAVFALFSSLVPVSQSGLTSSDVYDLTRSAVAGTGILAGAGAPSSRTGGSASVSANMISTASGKRGNRCSMASSENGSSGLGTATRRSISATMPPPCGSPACSR